MATLSDEEKDRYKRHLLLPEIGGQGQRALKASKVLVVGAGGLGCPILSYLAAAGVGTIGLCDGDRVELSNLQRQPLYGVEDIGAFKVDAAVKTLSNINPHNEYKKHIVFLDESNAENTISGYDLIIEGLDRYAPRYVLNAACLALGKPFLSVAIGRFDGQIALFEPGVHGKPCYACLVPSPPTDEAHCETEGVLGAVPGVVGALAATEAIKWICRMDGALSAELLIYTGLQSGLRRVRLAPDPECAVCAGILY
ncbi:MAG: HesA/MoeB/ThiF family protein [Pseudomonadota bacterium]